VQAIEPQDLTPLFHARVRAVTTDRYNSDMSYNLTLDCGCLIYVAVSPTTGMAHTRIIEKRGPTCPRRKHDVGVRLWLWELLPASPEQQRRPA
jgi:hypothetical protein